ncbi:MAG: hypothetical protein ACXABO_11250 [Promethearchaeota archaeon]
MFFISNGNSKVKKRRGRPRKFVGKSKVISFRIDERLYANKKAHIREKIDFLIQEEVAHSSLHRKKGEEQFTPAQEGISKKPTQVSENSIEKKLEKAGFEEMHNQKGNAYSQAIYDEFWEFISDDNLEFNEFITKDKRRNKRELVEDQ